MGSWNEIDFGWLGKVKIDWKGKSDEGEENRCEGIFQNWFW